MNPQTPTDPVVSVVFYIGARLRLIIGALALVLLVFLVYHPILPGNLILDDQRLLEEGNPLVTGELKPHNIWFQTDFTLSTLTFWIEHRIWGLDPGPYHAVNMLLHAVSAFLLWRVLKRLNLAGAWVAAAVFAVHPVCVNSVARIAELKNTLSLPFFLLGVWAFLHYENFSEKTPRPAARTALYTLSLIAFVLALLGKTSTVMLPAVLLACALWRRNRIRREDVFRTTPFFILGAGFGLMSIWFQKHQALAQAGQILAPMSFSEHIVIAARVFWFYLGKALWPLNLILVYPRWEMPMSSWATYIPPILLLAAFAVCWRARRQWGRPVLFGLGVFAIALFPVLGFFDSQFLVTWQVSDHLQYLPLIAPVSLAAAGLAWFSHAKIFPFAAASALVLLSIGCYERAEVFSSPETLLRDTLAKNPAAWKAHNDLGTVFAARTNYAKAGEHFSASLHFNPDNFQAHVNLGRMLALQGKFAEAEPHFQTALQLAPFDPETHKTFATALDQQGRVPEAMHHLKIAASLKPDLRTHLDLAALLCETGEPAQAVAHYRRALKMNGDCVEALNNLAWILATSADDHVRNGAEAVQHAERAAKLPAMPELCILGTLAASYAEAGRFSEAITTAETAVKNDTAAGRENFANLNRQLLRLYRKNKAWHERPVAENNRYNPG